MTSGASLDDINTKLAAHYAKTKIYHSFSTIQKLAFLNAIWNPTFELKPTPLTPAITILYEIKEEYDGFPPIEIFEMSRLPQVFIDLHVFYLRAICLLLLEDDLCMGPQYPHHKMLFRVYDYLMRYTRTDIIQFLPIDQLQDILTGFLQSPGFTECIATMFPYYRSSILPPASSKTPSSSVQLYSLLHWLFTVIFDQHLVGEEAIYRCLIFVFVSYPIFISGLTPALVTHPLFNIEMFGQLFIDIYLIRGRRELVPLSPEDYGLDDVEEPLFLNTSDNRYNDIAIDTSIEMVFYTWTHSGVSTIRRRWRGLLLNQQNLLRVLVDLYTVDQIADILMRKEDFVQKKLFQKRFRRLLKQEQSSCDQHDYEEHILFKEIDMLVRHYSAHPRYGNAQKYLLNCSALNPSVIHDLNTVISLYDTFSFVIHVFETGDVELELVAPKKKSSRSFLTQDTIGQLAQAGELSFTQDGIPQTSSLGSANQHGHGASIVLDGEGHMNAFSQRRSSTTSQTSFSSAMPSEYAHGGGDLGDLETYQPSYMGSVYKIGPDSQSSFGGAAAAPSIAHVGRPGTTPSRGGPQRGHEYISSRASLISTTYQLSHHSLAFSTSIASLRGEQYKPSITPSKHSSSRALNISNHSPMGSGNDLDDASTQEDIIDVISPKHKRRALLLQRYLFFLSADNVRKRMLLPNEGDAISGFNPLSFNMYDYFIRLLPVYSLIPVSYNVISNWAKLRYFVFSTQLASRLFIKDSSLEMVSLIQQVVHYVGEIYDKQLEFYYAKYPTINNMELVQQFLASSHVLSSPRQVKGKSRTIYDLDSASPSPGSDPDNASEEDDEQDAYLFGLSDALVMNDVTSTTGGYIHSLRGMYALIKYASLKVIELFQKHNLSSTSSDSMAAGGISPPTSPSSSQSPSSSRRKQREEGPDVFGQILFICHQLYRYYCKHFAFSKMNLPILTPSERFIQQQRMNRGSPSPGSPLSPVDNDPSHDLSSQSCLPLYPQNHLLLSLLYNIHPSVLTNQQLTFPCSLPLLFEIVGQVNPAIPLLTPSQRAQAASASLGLPSLSMSLSNHSTSTRNTASSSNGSSSNGQQITDLDELPADIKYKLIFLSQYLYRTADVRMIRYDLLMELYCLSNVIGLSSLLHPSHMELIDQRSAEENPKQEALILFTFDQYATEIQALQKRFEESQAHPGVFSMGARLGAEHDDDGDDDDDDERWLDHDSDSMNLSHDGDFTQQQTSPYQHHKKRLNQSYHYGDDNDYHPSPTRQYGSYDENDDDDVMSFDSQGSIAHLSIHEGSVHVLSPRSPSSPYAVYASAADDEPEPLALGSPSSYDDMTPITRQRSFHPASPILPRGYQGRIPPASTRLSIDLSDFDTNISTREVSHLLAPHQTDSRSVGIEQRSRTPRGGDATPIQANRPTDKSKSVTREMYHARRRSLVINREGDKPDWSSFHEDNSQSRMDQNRGGMSKTPQITRTKPHLQVDHEDDSEQKDPLRPPTPSHYVITEIDEALMLFEYLRPREPLTQCLVDNYF